MHFVLCVSITRIERKAQIISSLNFIIEYFLREQGIVMPLPQRDIWIRNPEALTNHSDSAQRAQVYNDSANKNINLRDILPQISYFRNCGELQLRKLIEAGYRHQINKSELLYSPGDTSDEFYIILSGALELVDEKLDKRLRTIEAGKIIGEIAIMLGIPRQITLRAIEDTNLFVIKAQVFRELLQDLPSLAEQIATDITQSQKVLVQHKTYLQKLGLIEKDIEESSRKKRIRDRIKNIFSSPREKLPKNDSPHIDTPATKRS